MGRGARGGGGAADQEELASGAVLVDQPAHHVPDLRNLLPFIDQQRANPGPDQLRVRLDRCPVGSRVELEQAPGALLGRGRLADRFRPVDSYRWNLGEEVVQFVIDDAPEVLHR